MLNFFLRNFLSFFFGYLVKVIEKFKVLDEFLYLLRVWWLWLWVWEWDYKDCKYIWFLFYSIILVRIRVLSYIEGSVCNELSFFIM